MRPRQCTFGFSGIPKIKENALVVGIAVFDKRPIESSRGKKTMALAKNVDVDEWSGAACMHVPAIHKCVRVARLRRAFARSDRRHEVTEDKSRCQEVEKLHFPGGTIL